MSEQLYVPCPGCGQTDEIKPIESENIPIFYSVVCTRCGWAGPVMPTRAEADHAWNWRWGMSPQVFEHLREEKNVETTRGTEATDG